MSINTGSNTPHWGEFEDRSSSQEESGLSVADMEDLLYPEAPRHSPLVLHQPSQEKTSTFQILPLELCRSDPLVLHTIRLLQHQRTILQLIARAQSIGSDGGVLPACPAPPADIQTDKKNIKQSFLNFFPPEVTPFTCAQKQSQKLEVESSTARLILRKAVATTCAHAGFTDTTESVLRVLTDVTHEFFSKFTCVLRNNTDQMMISKNTPFHDVVEKTLRDIDMGSMTDLHGLYKEGVVSYHAKVRQKTLQLHQHYQNILTHAQEGASVYNQGISTDSKDIQLLQAAQSQMNPTTPR